MINFSKLTKITLAVITSLLIFCCFNLNILAYNVQNQILRIIRKGNFNREIVEFLPFEDKELELLVREVITSPKLDYIFEKLIQEGYKKIYIQETEGDPSATLITNFFHRILVSIKIGKWVPSKAAILEVTTTFDEVYEKKDLPNLIEHELWHLVYDSKNEGDLGIFRKRLVEIRKDATLTEDQKMGLESMIYAIADFHLICYQIQNDFTQKAVAYAQTGINSIGRVLSQHGKDMKQNKIQDYFTILWFGFISAFQAMGKEAIVDVFEDEIREQFEDYLDKQTMGWLITNQVSPLVKAVSRENYPEIKELIPILFF